MVECGGRFCFVDKAGAFLFGHGNVAGQELNGHVTVERGVVGFVHHTHPALAEMFEDGIMGYFTADHSLYSPNG